MFSIYVYCESDRPDVEVVLMCSYLLPLSSENWEMCGTQKAVFCQSEQTHRAGDNTKQSSPVQSSDSYLTVAVVSVSGTTRGQVSSNLEIFP